MASTPLWIQKQARLLHKAGKLTQPKTCATASRAVQQRDYSPSRNPLDYANRDATLDNMDCAGRDTALNDMDCANSVPSIVISPDAPNQRAPSFRAQRKILEPYVTLSSRSTSRVIPTCRDLQKALVEGDSILAPGAAKRNPGLQSPTK